MKWLVGFLVVVNAALFLLATGYDSNGPVDASTYPVVSAESMRLLKEARAHRESAAAPGPRCARIGPFVSSAVASLAAQKLDEMALNYSRRTVKAREIRASRVYLGPFETQSALQTQRQLLASAGVEDYYVKREGEENAGIVSLGLFSQREGAEVLLGKLARADVEARIRSEDRVLKPNYWLEIEDPAVAEGTPAELTGVSWGESGARLRRYACS